jgi:hypothetical protein
VPLASRPEYDLRSLVRSKTNPRASARLRPSANDPSMRFCAPSAYEISGSDPHRICLTRLCYAFRLFQPLDASFRPEILPALFHAGDAHGFSTFRGFPLPIARLASRRAVPSVPSSRPLPLLPKHQRPQIAPGSEDSCTRQVRSPRAGVTRWPWADPLLAFPLRGLHPMGLGSMLPRNLLSWTSVRRSTVSRPSPHLLYRVSKNPPGVPPLSRTVLPP